MKHIKTLLVSANYPNQYYLWAPWNLMANNAISKLDNVDIEIIAPIPYSLPINHFPYNNLTKIPYIEHSKEGKVHRPKFLYLTDHKLFYGMTGEFYKKSVSKYIFKNVDELDIIHSHQAYPDGYAMIDLSRSLSIPSIVEIHSTNTLNTWFNNRSINKKIIKTLNSSDKIICISKELCNLVKKLGIKEEENIIHIPLGVDITLFKPYDVENLKNKLNITNEKVLLFVGRLIKLKNVDIILKAILKITSNYKNFKLLIVGDGSEKEDLLKLSKDLNLNKYVEFLGEKKGIELAQIYSLADILVLASSTEGRPMVIYEAMASECAVIATNIGGIPEQITEGENGFLVNNLDSSVLAYKIIELLENEQLLNKMKKKCRKRIIKKDWTWEGYAKKIEKVYNVLRV
jgi:teichuronic acid biosynthesis glycosyltransferase TuaC